MGVIVAYKMHSNVILEREASFLEQSDDNLKNELPLEHSNEISPLDNSGSPLEFFFSFDDFGSKILENLTFNIFDFLLVIFIFYFFVFKTNFIFLRLNIAKSLKKIFNK